MQLTRHTDYAFRFLIYLKAHPGRTVSIAEVSNAYRISHNHLAKVAQSLTSHGYTRVVRGRSGGLQLDRSPESIKLGQVVRDFEPTLNLVECFGSGLCDCPITPVCRLKTILKEAQNTFLDTLDQHTLSELTPDLEGIKQIWSTTARGER
jgi:Rrf2 family nitric oxide-sensitive transcriptional repressor